MEVDGLRCCFHFNAAPFLTLVGDDAVFTARSKAALGFVTGKGKPDFFAGGLRQDDTVNKATLRRNVGVGEGVTVFFDFLAPHGRTVIGSLDFTAEDYVGRSSAPMTAISAWGHASTTSAPWALLHMPR